MPEVPHIRLYTDAGIGVQITLMLLLFHINKCPYLMTCNGYWKDLTPIRYAPKPNLAKRYLSMLKGYLSQHLGEICLLLKKICSIQRYNSSSVIVKDCLKLQSLPLDIHGQTVVCPQYFYNIRL